MNTFKVMRYEEIAKVDLNLLKLLKVLGEERNTRRAAERMFVGQPTVSKSLKRLRALFDDELFVREPHGLRPTPLCELVLRQLPSVFDAIERALSPHLTFDPASYSEELAIAINPVFYQPLIRRLYPRLRNLAPNASLRFVNWTKDTDAMLQQGQVAMGVNFAPINLPINIRSEHICEAEFGICCSTNAPFNIEGVSYSSLRKYPLILMVMPDFSDKISIAEQVLSQNQIEPNILLRSDQIDICFNALLQEDAGMPVSSLVSSILPEGLTVLPLPAEFPIPKNQIALYFAEPYKYSPKLVWLRSIVGETLLELFEEGKQS